MKKKEILLYFTAKTKKNNIAGTWKILRTIMGKKRNQHTYPELFHKDDKVIERKENIANMFNRFFTSVGPDLAKQINPPAGASIFDYLKNQNDNSMFLSPVDENEVIRVVESCKNKSSTDADGLSMNIVKHIITLILKPLTHIFNTSFKTGVFPDKFKIAKVIPVFKSGIKENCSNYRPISLLPQFSKILEKLFNSRLSAFLDKNNIINPSQYGFRENMSTSYALTELINEITSSLNNKMYSIGVFIDLKKAFDTVDHKLLCEKMYFYGIRGVAHNWITSYISNRSQFVCYDEFHSDLLNISCGVPQGSILGPKLFILYINDLCNISRLVKYILFADDTNLFCANKNIKQLVTTVSTVLDKLCTWFAVNKLSLNVSKTSYMLFGNLNAQVDIAINGISIDRVRVAKFLGVLIDEKLNWKEHIASVKTKLSKSTAILYKCSQVIDSQSMHILYNSLFLPYISYCSEIWGNTYPSNVNCLVVLQKRAMRLLYGAGRLDHTTPLFYRSHILKFPDLVKFKTAMFMYKAYYCMLPANIQQHFVKKNISVITRLKNQLERRCVTLNVRAMSLPMYGISLWNSLHVDLTNIKTIRSFRQRYKTILINEYI